MSLYSVQSFLMFSGGLKGNIGKKGLIATDKLSTLQLDKLFLISLQQITISQDILLSTMFADLEI